MVYLLLDFIQLFKTLSWCFRDMTLTEMEIYDIVNFASYSLLKILNTLICLTLDPPTTFTNPITEETSTSIQRLDLTSEMCLTPTLL